MSQSRLVLISGETTTGKSASLRNLKNPKKVMYLNSESGKDLPFKSRFMAATVTDPVQVPDAFASAETMGDKVETIIVDSITYLMDMFESQYVLGQADTMAGWSNFAQFFKKLLQKSCAESTKNVIMIGHTLTTFKDSDGGGEYVTAVPIKGSLKNNGVNLISLAA